MEKLKPILPIKITDLSPKLPPTGEPICERVDPTTLYVDHSYQRQVSERGRKQIRKVVEQFCRTKFKPPICAYAVDENGATVLKVLDGQHTAIAAASNPHVGMIPVMIVDAPDNQAQAAAFVGQNTQRVGITPLQLHQASVVSGDEDAMTVELVCARAGIKVITTPPAASKYRARETIAIATISGLVNRQTAIGARRILEVLANADFAPITSPQIRAAELLMTHKDFSQRFDPEDLTKTMAKLYLTAEEDAKVYAHAHKLPFFKALAIVWFRDTKKRRTPIRLVA